MFEQSDFIKYLTILSKNCPDNVICHCIAVSAYAYDFTKTLKDNHNLDLNVIILGGLLHDIGRCKSHDIDHGIIGAGILKAMGLPKLANIAETHIGAGITLEESKVLNLPIKNYIPITLEEKIIANVDNLIFGTKRVSIDEVVLKFKKRDCSEDVIKRILNLYNELNKLRN
ncbi:TIGR00295 family protein [Methanococcus voltae]|uniref:TIGR00295 family protein n=1 Tax=Methanococcus voltae TaxID=2188 RepID=UPI0032AFD69E